MFRIGEFSKLTQVSIRMLRYYDEVGLLKPAEVDKWTGHRMYSVTQIPRLNRILYLRDSGFLVSEIALALEMNDRLLLETLDKKRLEIEQTIQNEQEKIRKIAIAKNEIQESKGKLHYNISIKAIPEYQVLSLRRVVPTYYSEGDLWNELSAFAKEQKIEMSNHTFSVYHDTEYKEQNVDIELCVPVNKLCKDIAPRLSLYLLWPVRWCMVIFQISKERILLLLNGCKKTVNIECPILCAKLYIEGHGMKVIRQST